MSVKNVDGKINPMPDSFEQVDATSPAAGIGFTDARGVAATKALIHVESAGAGFVRWTDDGTTPTADVGMGLAVGTDMYYPGNLADIKFFGGIINVSYYY